ncbi:MAG: hypothetical protein JO102_03715, partial [Elusimicrobia bacterium]|nr:hypothetical protein [Elusimicrobiota bacterium]
ATLPNVLRRHIARIALRHVPELEHGFYFDGEWLDTNRLLEKIATEWPFRVPGYYDDYITMLRIFAGQQTRSFTDARYDVDPTQANAWSYRTLESLPIADVFRPSAGRQLSGHLAAHLTKDSWELLEAILTVDYLIPAGVYDRLNENNQMKRLMAKGALKKLMIPTEFIHFTIDDVVTYQESPFAFVYPVEMLLENQAFIQDPLSSTDWAVTGFSPDLGDPSHRIPASQAVLLVPNARRAKLEALLTKIKAKYPEWEPPTRIFYYRGRTAKAGLEQFRAEYHLTAPSPKVAIGQRPVVIRTLSGGQFKSDQIGVSSIAVLGIKASPALAQHPEVIKFSEQVREHLLDAMRAAGQVRPRVAMLGSAMKQTYVQQQNGFPAELDLMAVTDNPIKPALMLSLTAGLQEWLSRNAALLRTISRRPLRVEAATALQHAGARQFSKIKIFEGSEQNAALLTIDLEFHSGDESESRLAYDQRFQANLDHLVSTVATDYQQRARQHLLALIRDLKALLRQHRLYYRDEGGLRSVGAEQLVLQLYGVEDHRGTPIPASFDSLKKFQQAYSLEAVMRRVVSAMFVDNRFVGLEQFVDNLALWDPGSVTPRNLASGIDQAAFHRLVTLASHYVETRSLPAGLPATGTSGTLALDFSRTVAEAFHLERDGASAEVIVAPIVEGGLLLHYLPGFLGRHPEVTAA